MEILQTEVAFHPGEMALDIAAPGSHQTPPLSQEEPGVQFRFARASQVVVHRRMSAQKLMHHALETPDQLAERCVAKGFTAQVDTLHRDYSWRHEV